MYYYKLNPDKTVSLTAYMDFSRLAVSYVNQYTISTVFLRFDISFGMKKCPILFETMISDASTNRHHLKRYHDWHEAMIGHSKAVQAIKIFSSYKIS